VHGLHRCEWLSFHFSVVCVLVEFVFLRYCCRRLKFANDQVAPDIVYGKRFLAIVDTHTRAELLRRPQLSNPTQIHFTHKGIGVLERHHDAFAVARLFENNRGGQQIVRVRAITHIVFFVGRGSISGRRNAR